MNKITPLDVNWCGRPKSIAAALLQSENHAALIDPGPESTLTTLRDQLRANGLAISDLNAILITHIHLDHAGATGKLVRENPNLKIYVHSNGARHMADPSKLIASATRLWGDQLPILFGETLPVPQENLQILEGGETLTLGQRKLDVAYTPGHASHHVSYFDSDEGVAFIGDTAGIRIDNSPYIYPATPPPDVDLALWDKSFQTILRAPPLETLPDPLRLLQRPRRPHLRIPRPSPPLARHRRKIPSGGNKVCSQNIPTRSVESRTRSDRSIRERNRSKNRNSRNGSLHQRVLHRNGIKSGPRRSRTLCLHRRPRPKLPRLKPRPPQTRRIHTQVTHCRKPRAAIVPVSAEVSAEVAAEVLAEVAEPKF